MKRWCFIKLIGNSLDYSDGLLAFIWELTRGVNEVSCSQTAWSSTQQKLVYDFGNDQGSKIKLK